jgi:magnesium transporter
MEVLGPYPDLPDDTASEDAAGDARLYTISLLDYGEGRLTEKPDASIEECRTYLDTPGSITWFHVQGAIEPAMLRQLGAVFKMHSLALEDVMIAGHRPKAEVYDNQLFVILSRPVWRDDALFIEQISLFYDENRIISFSNGAEDPFEPIRNRLRKQNGWLRERQSDFLLYGLIDLIVDEGFPVLEDLGARIETLEDELLETPGRHTLSRLHALKADLLLLRRMMWPHREVLNSLMRDDFPLLQESTKVYLRDCYDHIVHIIELLEAYRDMTASILDVYLSSVSNKLNKNMRLLTVISTIFMPLTFVAGVYGMNFRPEKSPWNMPELNWYYGYPFALLLMLGIVVAMLTYFWRKKWL